MRLPRGPAHGSWISNALVRGQCTKGKIETPPAKEKRVPSRLFCLSNSSSSLASPRIRTVRKAISLVIHPCSTSHEERMREASGASETEINRHTSVVDIHINVGRQL